MRKAIITRDTKETNINLELNIDGLGKVEIDTGIPFLDHMLTLFGVHGFFDLKLKAKGDIAVDYHHTTEDIGLVLGEAFNKALSDRKKIKRYGFFNLPMDETFCVVSLDLSNRPYLVFNAPRINEANPFDIALTKEFFRAFTNKLGANLHINVLYGENEHHIIEAIFKACAKSLNIAVSIDDKLTGVLSTKGVL